MLVSGRVNAVAGKQMGHQCCYTEVGFPCLPCETLKKPDVFQVSTGGFVLFGECGVEMGHVIKPRMFLTVNPNQYL